MKQKVNIYYAGFKHRVGGAYFHVVNFSKGLIELGYEVNIITLDKLPLIIRFLPHLLQKLGNTFNFPIGYYYKQRCIRYFFKKSYKDKADIDVFEDIYTYWKSNTKSIVILHALWSDNLQATRVSNNQRNNLEKKEVRLINGINCSINTVSVPYRDFILSRLKPLGLTKGINVTELGVDICKFTIAKNNNKSIIFVGSLEERKNIKFLLKVFMSLRLIANYKLTIVGDGPQKSQLIDYIKNNGIEHVTFLGRLSYDNVIKELPSHQYYMHTSTKESFSYSLLEAKLSGLTTIAFVGLEVPEEFIDIKVSSFNVAEWSESISKYQALKSDIDSNKYSYKTMTKNTLRWL
jgi:glycosyltransferase involved in cell wall biosynthesis